MNISNCLVPVYLMTELIQMAPLIKNSFYLLDACLLFIPTTAYINSRNVNVCVCVCVAVCGELRQLPTSGGLLCASCNPL